MKISFASVKAELNKIGVSVRKRDGEYRVNTIGGTSASAYFTDDLTDALGTGRLMAGKKAA